MSQIDEVCQPEGDKHMALWDEQGSILMENGLLLWAHMSANELTGELRSAAKRQPDAFGPQMLDRIERLLGSDAFDRVVPLPAMPVVGGELAPVCSFHGDRLHAVSFSVTAVGLKPASADQQRAFLFECAHVQDPAPDTRKCVSLYCGFGSVVLSTDPRSGQAQMRLTYR